MKTLLIVEDEKMIRQGIHTMVQRSGVPVENIIECNNAEKALEILSEQEVDVMFTDIRMPKMDGIELVNRMRSLPHVPLTVAISGYDDFSYAVEMLRNGVREYILKPVERDKIREVLETLNKEIEEKREREAEDERFGYSQIKHIMLSDTLEKEDIAIIEKQYGQIYAEQLGGSYYVCIRNRRERAAQDAGKCILLENIEGNDVFIIAENAMEDFEADGGEDIFDRRSSETYAGVSGVHKELEELSLAYREAFAARKKAFARIKECVRFDGAKERIPEELVNAAAKLAAPEARQQWVQYLGTEHTDKLEKSFEQFFGAVRNGRISPETFEKCIEEFLDEILKTYKNAIPDDAETIEELKQIWAEDCLDSYEEKFMGFVLHMQERINGYFAGNVANKKMKQALEYINAHYAEDLNMAVVSNYISMNYSLFSYSFKQYTGRNFVSYLRDIRLNKAKELLADTDYKINEISQMTGYDNEKHFMKSFKQYIGVSPSEYRKNTKMGGTNS